jgi:hypothetical protein
LSSAEEDTYLVQEALELKTLSTMLMAAIRLSTLLHLLGINSSRAGDARNWLKYARSCSEARIAYR